MAARAVVGRSAAYKLVARPDRASRLSLTTAARRVAAGGPAAATTVRRRGRLSQ